MRRSSRLFEIIQVLRTARAPTTAQRIATTLEVHKRTVYRDIAALQAMRVPIAGEAGIGYVLRPGFDLPPLMFSTEEVEAIAVGLSLLARTGDTGLQAAASRVASKIGAVLPDGAKGPDDMPLHVSRWTAVPSAGADHRVLREAIRDERALQLDYRDAADRASFRTVHPIALIYYVDSVVLAAWCNLRADYRHFRIDRIAACTSSTVQFKGNGARLRAEWASRAAPIAADAANTGYRREPFDMVACRIG